ncbi:hypothetical protein Nepgr_005451 [Nepenthes gracilis]|uniref:Uncharacterized protein n=1 Tax=Nepenthes gracilis TaxID=150966 RepID=A0AAD3XGG0_NEPGR|nr:hypothetical protein Nepgr_005451 [Nepenthes gracilis]
MSSLQPTLTSTSLHPKIDEQRWVIQIRQTLNEQSDDDNGNNDAAICIFDVPKALRATDPELYTPQVIALGPYHCWRPELREMERYKLSAAKRTQRQLQSIKFQTLVDHLKILAPRIRASYNKYLDITSETLAWMTAVDSSFLLEFLQTYAANDTKALVLPVSRMSHLVDSAGKKSTQNAILRDMVMLENQLPLFVLRKVLEFRLQSVELADDKLFLMIMGLCQDLSPFKMLEDLPRFEVSDCAHLLDFLYRVVVPKTEGKSEVTEADDQQETALENEQCLQGSRYIKLFLRFKRGTMHFTKGLKLSWPVKVIFKLPWFVITSLPVFTILKQPVEYLFSSQNTEARKPETQNSDSKNNNNPPLMEEIMIPSVVELSKSGILFCPSDGGISGINFDKEMNKFYLPAISLDENSEVIFRNLTAYEASNASGPLMFTRYTELMNGIVDTESDAKLLREKGIILNHLKSDKEVANMWNEMSKSIRLTKVPFLDEVIEEVNMYYDGKWKVKVGKLMKRYVFNSWQILTFIAAVLFLLLMTLQVFSALFNCTHMRHTRINR